MNRAVFLDRDNTIIENDGDLGDPDAVRLMRGAAHAIQSLRLLGYQIVVVSNQAGVARGAFTEADVDSVHQRIAELVYEAGGAAIDRFYYCPFHPEGTVPDYTRDHPWRKPQPGMILQAAKDLGIDVRESWMVGDGERDVLAGRAAGCQTIRLTLPGVADAASTAADFKAANLAEAASIIATHRSRGRSRLQPASPSSMRDSAPSSILTMPATPAPPPPPRPAESPRSAFTPVEPLAPSPPSLSTPDRDRVASLLTDLLSEVRSWRHTLREFTAWRMLWALALIGFVIFGAAAALYFPADQAMRWIGVAILAQLAILGLIVLGDRT